MQDMTNEWREWSWTNKINNMEVLRRFGESRTIVDTKGSDGGKRDE